MVAGGPRLSARTIAAPVPPAPVARYDWLHRSPPRLAQTAFLSFPQHGGNRTGLSFRLRVLLSEPHCGTRLPLPADGARARRRGLAEEPFRFFRGRHHQRPSATRAATLPGAAQWKQFVAEDRIVEDDWSKFSTGPS